MAGREGLAKGAGVENIHIFIGHALNPLVTVPVFLPCLFGEIAHILLFRVESHGHLVQNASEILMEFGMENHTDVLKREPLLHRGLPHPYP